MCEEGFLQGSIFHYGKHTRIGINFFVMFNLAVQDDAKVRIGDNCFFGSNVTIVTPVHPMIASGRRTVLDRDGIERYMCYAKPVSIGNDCWLCADVTACLGVTMGDNYVIGAGSVVTRDIPDNSFAAGNPCRVIRMISESDSLIYRPEILADNQLVPRKK